MKRASASIPLSHHPHPNHPPPPPPPPLIPLPPLCHFKYTSSQFLRGPYNRLREKLPENGTDRVDIVRPYASRGGERTNDELISMHRGVKTRAFVSLGCLISYNNSCIFRSTNNWKHVVSAFKTCTIIRLMDRI